MTQRRKSPGTKIPAHQIRGADPLSRRRGLEPREIRRSASSSKPSAPSRASEEHLQQRGNTPPPKPPPTAPPPPGRRRLGLLPNLHYIQDGIRGFPRLPLPEQPPEAKKSRGSPPHTVVSLESSKKSPLRYCSERIRSMGCCLFMELSIYDSSFNV